MKTSNKVVILPNTNLCRPTIKKGTIIVHTFAGFKSKYKVTGKAKDGHYNVKLISQRRIT